MNTTGQTTTTQYVIQNNLITGYQDAPYKIKNNNYGQDLSPLYIYGASQNITGTTFRSSDIYIQGGTKGVDETHVYIHNPIFTGSISGVTTGTTDLSNYYTKTESDARYVNITGDTMIGNLSLPSLRFDTTYDYSGATHIEGQINWNSDDHTAEIHTDIDGVRIQVGQEQVVRGTNKTGVLITNGQVILVSGATGNRPKFVVADNTSSQSHKVIGVATSDIDDNNIGYVTTHGLVRGLNTERWVEGDILWLFTNGTLTNIEPIAPTHKIRIGTVIRSHKTQGIILVNIEIGPDMIDINDIKLTTLTDGQLLRWSGTTWSNWSPNYLTGFTAGSNKQIIFNSGGTLTGSSNLVYSNGNIGIGDTNPQYKLSISGATSNLYFNENVISSSNNLIILGSTSASKISLGTTSSSYDISIGGDASRTIGLERYTLATGVTGKDLTISSGGPKAGSTNSNGGNLLLKSGIATGSGTSSISFYTATPGTSGTTDVTPTEKMTILGNGNVGIGTTTPSAKLDIVALNTSSHILIGNDEIGVGRTLNTKKYSKISSARYDNTNPFVLIGGKSVVSTSDVMIGTTPEDVISGFTTNAYIQMHTAGALQFYISNGGTYSNQNIYVLNKKIAVNFNSSGYVPTYDIELGYLADRTIGMQRAQSGTAKNLTIASSDALAGGTNLNGGNLILKSGIATGNGTSNISFYTATAGASGSGDTLPTEKMRILGNGNVGINNTTPTAKLQVSGTSLFGSSLNNVNIAADGTLKLSGTATAFKDISYTMAIERVGPGTSLDTFIGSFRAYTLDIAVNDFIEYATVEVPHEWKNGSSQIDNHVHWACGGIDTTNRYVKFQLDILVANMTTDGINPVVTGASGIIFGTIYSATGETMIPANGTGLTHFYTELSRPLPSNLEFGAQMKVLLKRITASGAAPTNKPFILQVGQHIEIDSFGSSGEYGRF